MVKKELVAAKLEKIREYLKTLNIIQKYDLQKFKNDTFIHATAERYLHLSIECLLDIGNHIISDHGYRKPETYADIFQILAEENIISQELLKELEGMAAFRNVLVHDYLKLDLDKIYKIVQVKLKYIKQLTIVYASFL
ncbi:MAG: DUF86 domain-containing protein [Proteobacteria bacterium]|nr:DUF86 domain-containing protein [Pseudomonadota bacterium]